VACWWHLIPILKNYENLICQSTAVLASCLFIFCDWPIKKTIVCLFLKIIVTDWLNRQSIPKWQSLPVASFLTSHPFLCPLFFLVGTIDWYDDRPQVAILAHFSDTGRPFLQYLSFFVVTIDPYNDRLQVAVLPYFLDTGCPFLQYLSFFGWNNRLIRRSTTSGCPCPFLDTGHPFLWSLSIFWL